MRCVSLRDSLPQREALLDVDAEPDEVDDDAVETNYRVSTIRLSSVRSPTRKRQK